MEQQFSDIAIKISQAGGTIFLMFGQRGNEYMASVMYDWIKTHELDPTNHDLEEAYQHASVVHNERLTNEQATIANILTKSILEKVSELLEGSKE
ncbi:MAG TPA: hypothetical protein VGA67_01635 [Candidatus Dojkabacteria bacterium]|jgi:hypothetical protein